MHGQTIGSYVVFDPTGRDMRDCMQVGRVAGVVWDTDTDDGLLDGSPRPLLYVVPNGEDDPIACTTIAAVLWAPMEDGEQAPHSIATARTPGELTDTATIVLRLSQPMRVDHIADYVRGFANTLGADEWDLHAEDLTEAAVSFAPDAHGTA